MFKIDDKNGTALYWEDESWIHDAVETYLKVVVAHCPGSFPKSIVFVCKPEVMQEKGMRLVDAAAKAVLNDMDIPSYLAKEDRKWIEIS